MVNCNAFIGITLMAVSCGERLKVSPRTLMR